MSANAIPTPDQIAAAIEAMGEIKSFVYRVQKLVEMDDAHSCSLTAEVAPLLLNHIGCLADMAEGFLNGADNCGDALNYWMLPAGISKSMKGGAA